VPAAASASASSSSSSSSSAAATNPFAFGDDEPTDGHSAGVGAAAGAGAGAGGAASAAHSSGSDNPFAAFSAAASAPAPTLSVAPSPAFRMCLFVWMCAARLSFVCEAHSCVCAVNEWVGLGWVVLCCVIAAAGNGVLHAAPRSNTGISAAAFPGSPLIASPFSTPYGYTVSASLHFALVSPHLISFHGVMCCVLRSVFDCSLPFCLQPSPFPNSSVHSGGASAAPAFSLSYGLPLTPIASPSAASAPSAPLAAAVVTPPNSATASAPAPAAAAAAHAPLPPQLLAMLQSNPAFLQQFIAQVCVFIVLYSVVCVSLT
jgi:hypothetical protein